MANKYANLNGSNLIRDEYTKINTGFDGVEADINKLETDVTAVNTRVDTIITTPISGEAATQEIVDARVSAVKSKTFASLDARFEETEQDIATHKAENASYATDYLAALFAANVSIPNGVSTILPFSSLAAGSKASLLTDNGKTITLPAGTWLVNVKVTFASNATGCRRIEFARTDSTLAKGWGHAKVSANAVNGLDTTLEINRILNIAETRTYAVYVFQNSGSALNVLPDDANTLLSVRRIL